LGGEKSSPAATVQVCVARARPAVVLQRRDRRARGRARLDAAVAGEIRRYTVAAATEAAQGDERRTRSRA